MHKPTTHPEGTYKIAILSHSRLVTRMKGGSWQETRAHPKAGLPEGRIFYTSQAIDAAKKVHPSNYAGAILHVDGRDVYQLDSQGVVKHDKALFQKEPVVGQFYELEYRRGIGSVKGQITQEQAEKHQQQQSKSRSM